MEDTTAHLGRQRMEAATWQRRPRYGPRAPMPRHTWRALFGRAVAVSAAFVVFFALAIFARPTVPAYPKVKVVLTHATDTEGRPVTRAEWTARALEAAATL